MKNRLLWSHIEDLLHLRWTNLERHGFALVWHCKIVGKAVIMLELWSYRFTEAMFSPDIIMAVLGTISF